MKPRPQVIWMQLGVRNDEAAALAEANGLKVVMNRCPKIEYGRLSSEIAWMGVNTRTITAKRAKIGGGIQRLSLDRTSDAAARPTRPPPRARKATTAEWRRRTVLLAQLLVAVRGLTHMAVAS